MTNESGFGNAALFARKSFTTSTDIAYQINSIYRNDTWIR